MNRKLLYLFSLLTFFATMVSCSGDTGLAGESLLSEQDRIIVGCDTFSMHSSLCEARQIYSTPDSFLLGECDSRFGTIHADILAQFTCPIGFEYPANAEVDSVCLFFYYTSWFGDANTPMSLSIYEIDKQSLAYTEPYAHDVNIEDFCTVEASNMVLARERILVAGHPTDSVYNSYTNTYLPYVRMRLMDEFAQRFFAKQDFTSLAGFTNDFKGLYIQSNFGSATLLHVSDINLGVYYHFSYEKQGRDTVVSDIKGFYANREVRQVNRYIYLNEDYEALRADSNSVNYIVSPANLYTRVSLPIAEISRNIIGSIGEKRPYINKAEITLEVLNNNGDAKKTRDDWAQPAKHMLLIKESAVDRFFSKHELPSDTCAILASLTSVTDGNDSTRTYYSYNLASLLTETIRQIEKDSTIEEDMNMLLIPVSVETGTTSSTYGSYNTSSSSIMGVKHEQTVTATVIRSAQDAEHPLSMEVVYSGF